MKINRVYIKNFGGISDREYILSEGLNVIFGQNESGKSTFLSFIRFIFYGAKKQRSKELSFRDKYMPWNGEDMSGEIEFTLNDAEYFLSRSISATGRKKDITFINKTTGDTVGVSDADELGTELFNMSEQSFLKTLFLGAEGAQISSDGELLSKISNVAQSGDEKVSYQAICDVINNMIADLSSPRRSKAIIPALEKKLDVLKSQKAEAQQLYEQKSMLAQRLASINADLDNAIRTKTNLSEQSAKARQYADYIAYEKICSKLKEAEDAYKSILESSNGSDDKYEFLKNISPDEEKILLKDNSADISAAKMQEILLADKAKSAKTFSIISVIMGVLCIAAGVFYPIAFAGTAVLAALAVYFLVSSNKIRDSIADITDEISKSEKNKSDILIKYNLDSTEHYKILKRESADIAAREELRKSKADMVKGIYDERKAEFEALSSALTEKYGSTDNLRCEKTDIDEMSIAAQMKVIDEDILRYTADSAKIKRDAESAEGIAQQISNLTQEIKDLNESYDEANEKLRILNLAAEILEHSYEELKSNFAPRLARATARIFNSLTDGKYGELIVNDAFEIQIKNDGKYENSNFFSSGTIQQLYFSLRLGIIELIMGNYPLFIDDAFITYDDARFNNAAGFLNDYSKRNQIIFCTCHHRESNMMGAQVLKF